MSEEKQDGGRKERPFFELVAGAVLVIVVGATVYARYVEPRLNRWWSCYEVAKKTGMPIEKVKKFRAQGMMWEFWGPPRIQDVNSVTLDLLLNDPEIIEKLKQKKGSSGDELKKDVAYFVKSIGEIDWNYYCNLRSQNKGGYLTMVAATNYGINLENILQIPYQPTADDFLSLKKNAIPIEYSMPRLHQGLKPGEIIEEYSMEMTGVSAEVRQKYRAIETVVPYKGLNDEEIKVLAANDLTPKHIQNIVEEEKREEKAYLWTAFDLIKGGKLNGKIWEEWRPEVSVDDTLFGLKHGYSKERAVRANNLGRTLRHLHQDLLYHDLVDELRNDRKTLPMLNPAPK